MKKLLLTTVTAFTILFAQAQVQCQSDFSYMQNGPTTIFTNLSTVNPSWSTNYSVTWEWDFGDGTISTQQNPVHTYANNGIYTPCLTVVYFDSVIINTCVSVYCDSIFIGNGSPASWDCAPNTILGCADPGTGNGQFTSLSACQSGCGAPCPGVASIAQNTNIFTANITGGIAPYTYLWSTGETTQAITLSLSMSGNCDVTDANGCVYSANYSYSAGQFVACDSMTLVSTGGSPQTILMAEIPISFMDIHYWITTAPDGTLLGEDSLWNSHQIFNNMNNGQPYDTINICITYIDNAGYSTCCVTWVWNGSFWAKTGSVTSIGEIDLFDKKLIKVVDVLGRETSINSNQTLFFIYEDGTIEKRYIIGRK